MYVYINIHVYTYIHTHTQTHTYAHTYKHTGAKCHLEVGCARHHVLVCRLLQHSSLIFARARTHSHIHACEKKTIQLDKKTHMCA